VAPEGLLALLVEQPPSSRCFLIITLLQVDIRVLENDGNCSDAVITAAAAALKTFMRPDCVVVDGSITVAAAADVSLTLHALPVSVTFAIFQLANGEQVRLPAGFGFRFWFCVGV
jgi:exosome complex RNA-binding protein Rrp42 (RNase PH superfamily)